jgi:hypothetical protein
MGAPKWSAIITGGTGSGAVPIFQLNHSSNVTVTGLNFQNVNSMCVGNYSGSGSGNISGTHIYLNLFEHFPNEVIPVFLFDPTNVTIERNAFNDLQEDSIHLMSSTNGSGSTSYPSSNVIVRWNFGAGQGLGSGGTGAFIEIQVGALGLSVYQNVWYSQYPGRWEGMAFSIASGNTPCTETSPTMSGCSPLNSGSTGVTIDGNIVLDNNQPVGATDNMAAFEVMGTNPIVQNNYIRHWPYLGIYSWIFGYNASSSTHYTGNGTLTIANNVACDTYGANSTTFPVFGNEGSNGVPFDSSPIAVNSSSNTYAPSCANVEAPPALYSEIVAPPDLLDSSGGMWAISNSSATGPNTYWPNINAASGL